jgi:hypothetical protein
MRSSPQAATTPSPDPPPAPQAPQAPAAPQTPQAPSAPVTGAPSPEQLSTQIREQVRKSIEDARIAVRDARIAQQQVKHPEMPVVLPTVGVPDPPFDFDAVRPVIQTAINGFFITVVLIAIGVPLVRAFARRLGPAPAPPAIPPQVSEQLLRIEHAVEAMAIEVERISESQRFLTKIQAGKGEPVALPPRSSA